MRIPKVLWGFVLVVSIMWFGWSVYMMIWRSFFCLNLTEVQVNTLLSDIEGYLNRKMIYNNVCGGGPGFMPIVISSIGIWYGFWGWVLSSVKTAKKD